MDILETERKTVHLGAIMASSIRENNYTIVVMTPEYARKANEYKGGVGTETWYIMNLLKDNKDRVIPIIKQGQDEAAIPFYLQQINYIDFRNSKMEDENFNKLLLRMNYDFSFSKFNLNYSMSTPNDINTENETGSLIPNLRKITDLDKNRFIRKTFEYLKIKFRGLLKDTKEYNTNFDYILDDINSTKIFITLYVDGTQKTSYKLWIDNIMSSSDALYISHGRIYVNNDSSFNEVILVEEIDKRLKLKRTMNFMGNRGLLTEEELLINLWEDIVMQLAI